MSSYLFSTFNNRELATIIWVILIFAWVLYKNIGFYKVILDVLYAAIKLWHVFTFTLAYVGVSIYILYFFHFWNINLLKISIFWFFGWAIVMLMNSGKLGKEQGYLKKTFLEIIGVSAVVSFINNFYSFPLLVEILIAPFTFFLGAVSAFTGFDIKYAKVKKLIDWVIVIFTFMILGISLYRTIADLSNFANYNTLKEFLLPILLSFMFMPFVYCVYLYSSWQQNKIMTKYKQQEL